MNIFSYIKRACLLGYGKSSDNWERVTPERRARARSRARVARFSFFRVLLQLATITLLSTIHYN